MEVDDGGEARRTSDATEKRGTKADPEVKEEATPVKVNPIKVAAELKNFIFLFLFRLISLLPCHKTGNRKRAMVSR
jgi:hypothetical protein